MADDVQAATAATPSSAAPQSGSWGLMARAISGQHWLLLQILLAAAVANALALVTSLYSMQVYDRVIPNQGMSTLTVLTIGALLSVLLELSIRHVKAHLTEHLSSTMDVELSDWMMAHLLRIRLEHLPPRVGSLTTQLRGIDQVRGFALSALMFAIFDLPFAGLFVGFIALLGGSSLAAVPLAFLLAGLVGGLAMKWRIERRAASGFTAQAERQNLLVESVASMEHVRASGGLRRMLARWGDVTSAGSQADAAVRRSTESVQLWGALIGQLSYVALVSVGAFQLSKNGDFTMGALVACAIVGGRVLAPLSTLPSLLVQWGYARIAAASVNRLLALPVEGNHAQQLLRPTGLQGGFELRSVRFSYPGMARILSFPELSIPPGGRVAILGPVGCGKSSLLKLMAGLYTPTQGHVLVDSLNIDQIDRHVLRQGIAFVPQEAKFLSGTLRENLSGAVSAADDDTRLAEAMRMTGLDRIVASHPLGLDMQLGEGGAGLSAGQRQVATLCKLLLTGQRAWLLDEPGAALDDATERRLIQSIGSSLRPTDTLVLSTHRSAWLSLVDRVIVITADGRFIDSPRDKFLAAQQVAATGERSEKRHAAS